MGGAVAFGADCVAVSSHPRPLVASGGGAGGVFGGVSAGDTLQWGAVCAVLRPAAPALDAVRRLDGGGMCRSPE